MDGAKQAGKKTQVGRGTFGGGRGAANAEVVENVEFGQAMDVGYGERRPHANVEGIEDFPPSAPIETPEKKKRRRNGSPSTSAAATSAAPSSPIMFPPSKGMSSECCEEKSTPVPPPPSREQDALREDKTDLKIHYGSESEDGDDEELVPAFIIPRTERILLDTPQDEDDDAAPIMDSHPPTATASTSSRPATSAAPLTPIIFTISPGMSLECRESSTTAPPPPPREQDALREDKSDFLINYGSEQDESDDEGLPPVWAPRIARFLMDTPQDEDDADDAVPVMDSHPSTTTPRNTDPTPTASTSSGPAMGPNFYDFAWTPFPNPPFDPELRRETFSESNVGPTTPCVDPYDIFFRIWDRQIMEYIVSETNIYARELADLVTVNNALDPESLIAEWRDTTTDELYTYLAIILCMGCIFNPYIEDCWRTDRNIFSMPNFSAYMTLRRFKVLSKCLHFNRNENLCALKLGSPEAKLFKVKPVVSHLNEKFQQMYNLERDLMLDESLLQWKGRTLGFDQRLLKKAASIGLKSYEVCESQTGYLWRFEVHTCKGSQQADPLNLLDAFTPKIVLKLIQGLENKGHTLWMDSFYNSPALARKLKTLGFDCAGTLRTNRQLVPEALNQLTMDEMQPGMITGLTSGDVDVMVWRDTNRVAAISTYHGNTVVQKDGTTKPSLILDYKFMTWTLDKKDRMLARHPVERIREKVWYKKFFRRLLNVSVYNAYIICKKSSSHLDHNTFRETLVKSLLAKHGTGQMVVPDETPDHLSVKNHYLDELPFLAGKRVRQRRPCNICKKRVQTYCVGCDTSVCMTPCFVEFHIKLA